MEEETKAKRSTANINFTPDFIDNNPLLTFDPLTPNSSRNAIPAELTGRGKVLCVEVPDSQELKAGMRVTRMVEIYKCLSMGTLVQKFHGVLQKDDRLYYVMEHLGNASTLAALPSSLTALQRIQLAHNLAVTVAYLHSAGLLVKVLSDSSIFLSERNGELEPRVTNIEQARKVCAAG